MKRPILICLLGITLGVAATYLFESRDAISDWFTKPSTSTPEASAGNEPRQVFSIDSIPPEPEYQVVPIIGERFALGPGQGKAYHLAQVQNSEPFQIRWASNLPADLGIIASVLISQSSDTRALLNSSFCHEIMVTRFDHSCTLPPETNGVEMSLVVVDSRTGASTLGSIGAALLGSRRGLDQATANNNAALVLAQRRCVAHCP